jgi:hypothetical protein
MIGLGGISVHLFRIVGNGGWLGRTENAHPETVEHVGMTALSTIAGDPARSRYRHKVPNPEGWWF